MLVGIYFSLLQACLDSGFVYKNKFPLESVRFSKDPKTLRVRKVIRKTPTRLFRKAGLLYVVRGIKIKITAKFCDK